MVFAVVYSHLVDLLLWSSSCLVMIFGLWHMLGYFLFVPSQNHHVWSPALVFNLLYLPVCCVVVIYFLVGRVVCFRLKHLVEQQKRGGLREERLCTSLDNLWSHLDVCEAERKMTSRICWRGCSNSIIFLRNIICTLSIHESHVKDSEFHVPISSITGMIYWVVFTDNEAGQHRNLLLPFDESQIDPGNVCHLILKFTNH